MNSLIDFSTSDNTRTSIIRIAAALGILQILFPPKVFFIDSPLGSKSEGIGWHFIFSNPEPGGDLGFGMGHMGTGIAWMQLIGQLALTAGIAYVAIKALEGRRS